MIFFSTHVLARKTTKKKNKRVCAQDLAIIYKEGKHFFNIITNPDNFIYNIITLSFQIHINSKEKMLFL